ncbi:asparagine--tRNA ligase [bacterium]|nr:asparagine--tRNA ligase [bacterium]
MRPELYIEDIFNGQRQENDEVELHGWVYSKRSSGKVKFLMLRDGTGIMQGVLFPGDSSDSAIENFMGTNQESSVKVKGKIVKAPKAPGGWEIQVKELEEVGTSVEYPITPKEHGPDFLLNHRHLWIRSKRQAAVLRIRAEVVRSAREYFDSQGFVGFDAPIFTPNACEGTTDLFEVDYFEDNKAYLTQSGQLYGEAGAMALGKIYVFGPTFRAEKSKTRRHLTEFWMLEPEVAFMDLDGAMDLAEGMMCHIVQSVLKNRRRELETLERDISKLEMIKAPFPRIHYNEAADILEKESVDGFKKGADFGGGDETILTKKFETPIFVHRFPKKIKAFYMKEDPADDVSSLSFDMLAPEGYGEVIGAGQREESIEVLERKIKEHGLEQSVFDWYLDLRKFGSVPHSGFGIGIERCTTWLCGIQHVRETIPFPRMLNRISP